MKRFSFLQESIIIKGHQEEYDELRINSNLKVIYIISKVLIVVHLCSPGIRVTKLSIITFAQIAHSCSNTFLYVHLSFLHEWLHLCLIIVHDLCSFRRLLVRCCLWLPSCGSPSKRPKPTLFDMQHIHVIKHIHEYCFIC